MLERTDNQGWREARGEASLADVHGSIPVANRSSGWKRAAAFIGPGYLVAVGYMDPGNWATSLAGGSRYGYALLSVALLSNFMAIILQSLSARLAIATGRDLAQACRDSYSRPVSIALWVLAEIAIVATDIAEVIGTAIGLQLIFGLPLEIGVLVTSLDVFLILGLQKLGFRWVEAFIIFMLGVIALCFGVQIVLADPDWAAVAHGFLPSMKIATDPGMLYLALGILGATVMPHNLYLHSGIIQTRAYGETLPERREALRFATLDSTVALLLALLVNASILILAAAAFNANGMTDIAELGQAHALLSPMLGAAIAPTLFGIALIACGINSTATATLAGQIVMEGFIRMKLTPWIRRLATRALAIIPAAIVTLFYGEGGTAELLILSQVVLSLQLSFAVFPLVIFTADRLKMGALVAPRWLSALAFLTAFVIAALNIKLVYDFLFG